MVAMTVMLYSCAAKSSVDGLMMMVGSICIDLWGQNCHILLQQADSKGDLCSTCSPTLTGSSSTLASSVIEVELERSDPELAQQPNQELVLDGYYIHISVNEKVVSLLAS